MLDGYLELVGVGVDRIGDCRFIWSLMQPPHKKHTIHYTTPPQKRKNSLLTTPTHQGGRIRLQMKRQSPILSHTHAIPHQLNSLLLSLIKTVMQLYLGWINVYINTCIYDTNEKPAIAVSWTPMKRFYKIDSKHLCIIDICSNLIWFPLLQFMFQTKIASKQRLTIFVQPLPLKFYTSP